MKLWDIIKYSIYTTLATDYCRIELPNYRKFTCSEVG